MSNDPDRRNCQDPANDARNEHRLSSFGAKEHCKANDDMMRLARSHRLTAYDAAYLELALRKGAPLATLDRRLAEAARAEGVSVVE